MASLRNFTYDNMVKLIRQIWHGVDDNLTEINEQVNTNTENINNLTETVEELSEQNINPNIFRGTNVYANLLAVNSTDTWSTGEWCLYSASSGTNTASPIELTDSPIDDVEIGWEIDNSEGILQSNIPLSASTYTISAYLRGDGNAYLVYLNNDGTTITQSLGSSFSDWTYVAVTLNNTLNYQTLGFSHSSTSSSGPGSGSSGGGTTSQSIEICGMKLEAGDTETAWCPAYYDMENKYLQEDFDAIQSQVAEISSNIDSMQEAIDNVQTQVSNLQSEVTSIRTEVNNIQTEVTENQTSITNLQTQVDEISTTVTNIQTQVTENTNSITNVQNQVDEVSTAVDNVQAQVDANTEDINNLTDTIEEIVSESINPNIFRGTNVYSDLLAVNSSDTWSTGDWCLYSTSSGTNSVSPIELTDSPINDVEVGWEIDNSEGILQSNIPLESGTYTISAYVRGEGNAYLVYLNNNGTSTTQSLNNISSSDWTYVSVTLNNTRDYQTLGFSHSSSSTGGPSGGPGGSTTNQSIEVCGMKLEAGETATAWCPAYYDMENKYLQEDFDTIQNQVTEISSNIDNMQEVITNTQSQVAENITNISAVQQQVTEIIAEGGEPNVIEEIQVNGTALAVEDKTVNVPVPTKTSELENDSDFTTGSEVKSEIAAQIAEVVADAPEDLDTLKEIADWIEGHAEDAAAMNSEIKANTESIAEIASQIDNIQSAVDAVDETATANQSAITSLQEQISNVQEVIITVQSDIKSAQEDINANSNVIDLLQNDVAINQTNIASIQTQIDELSETVANMGLEWEEI